MILLERDMKTTKKKQDKNRKPGTWKKGQSGNPKGRPPKGYSITEWFREMLAKKPEVKEAIGKSIIKKALEGDSAAQRLVWNYMDGMPHQSTDITSDGKKLEGLVIIKNEDKVKPVAK